MRLSFGRLILALPLAVLAVALMFLRAPRSAYASPDPAGVVSVPAMVGPLLYPGAQGLSPVAVTRTDQYGPGTGTMTTPVGAGTASPVHFSTTGEPGPTTGSPAPDACWLYDSWCAYCTDFPAAAHCAAYPPGHRSASAAAAQPAQAQAGTTGSIP